MTAPPGVTLLRIEQLMSAHIAYHLSLPIPGPVPYGEPAGSSFCGVFRNGW